MGDKKILRSGNCRGEPQRLEVTEDGHITVSLEDFLGIDKNNLAVTLLFSKSAQLRCSCWQAEVFGSKIITELDKANASNCFCSF